MRAAPPQIARWILTRVLPSESRGEILMDLEDLWTEKASTLGRRKADRWYWTQVLKAIGPSIARDARGRVGGDEGMTSSMVRDVTFALKQLRRHPGVGLVVVLTLSVGIGATTSIFSAVHAVLLKELPYESPAELVMITSEAGGSSLPRYVSGPDLLDMREAVPALDQVAGFMEATVGPMTEVDRPQHILTAPVTWNAFEMLGVPMAIGRSFTPEDAVPVSADSSAQIPRAAVISHDFWQRQFGGDPGVLGQVVRVWGGASEIVGVLPAGFQLILPPELNIPANGDVWRVIRWDMSQWSREWRWLRTIGRLAEGASLQRARQETTRFAADLRSVHPHHAGEQTDFRLTTLAESAAAPMRGPLWLLMGAVSLVLLIACANVANLLLARGAARADEMAVRSSLGAGSKRLVRQLLTESAVLAALGAVGGVALAVVGMELLLSIRPPDLHRLDTIRLDVPVLLFTVVAASAATVLSGLVPALRTARQDPATHLRSARGGISVGRRSRAGLVITEVALSVTLLVGAGLLIRTIQELQRMPLGFDYEEILTITATQSNRPTEERQAYERELLRAAESVPGVTAAGIVFPLPMNGIYERSAEYAPDGRQTDPSGWTTAYFRTVSPTYFQAMGLEMKRGREFHESDENYDVPVVILDERLAEREFPGRDPVGEPLWVRGMEGDTLRAEILGVVEYAPQGDHRDLRPTMYFPRTFYQSHEVSLVVRTADDPTRVGPLLSQAVRGVDPRFPSDLVPMKQYVQDRLTRSRFLSILMQVFGALALGLSAVGLYGVLAYAVRQRRREMGLRLALGAEGKALTAIVVRNGMQLALAGTVAGTLGALVIGQGLRAQLFRVGVVDLPTMIGSAALVLLVALLASMIPAVRAARVNPVTALQEE